MGTPTPETIEVFLDESGTFVETSTDPAERHGAASGRPFPSQLAGLVAAPGRVDAGSATEVLSAVFGAAGLTYDGAAHATDLRRGEAYDRLVMALTDEVRRRGWQPVRLVNLERVSYGDRVSTYTNLVAELVLRVCQRQRAAGRPRLRVRLNYAVVTLGETEDGTLVFLEADEYLGRLREYLAFAAVRAGLAEESAHWQLDRIRQKSGRRDPALQVCDVLSNASHDGYVKCGPEAARKLREAFGSYDFSLRLREPLARAEEAAADGSLGLALRVLAERLVQEDRGGLTRGEARAVIEDVLDRLAALAAPARVLQLSTLSAWLEQIVECQRSAELGSRVAAWLRDRVENPLRSRLAHADGGGSLDGFAHALDVWDLTARNHAGDFSAAAERSRSLDARAPRLAGRWEFIDLMIRGWVAQAVLATDRFEHPEAARRMKSVADSLGVLSDLVRDALPGVVPGRVRSELRARALGTWLQAEVFAGLTEPSRLPAARVVSDQAIDEFTSEADKARQHQYRAQLETAAGDFAAARRFLTLSLGCGVPSHEAIAAAVRDLGAHDLAAQGFAMLHWLRLAASAAASGDTCERDAALSAWLEARLVGSSWAMGQQRSYPAHGILRRLAVLHASDGRRDEALTYLHRLRELTDTPGRTPVVLLAVLAAAQAETAGLLWDEHPHAARKLLDHPERPRLGLRQHLSHLTPRATVEAPTLGTILTSWAEPLDRLLAGTVPDTRTVLIRLARPIGF